MAKKDIEEAVSFTKPAQEIEDISVADEMSKSFLEYSYSVIYSRALPDARDGLKPVHRRILYTMISGGYTPDKSHVKSARIVGSCFAKGALVHTPEGLRPVESLKIGDPILTPEGEISSVSKTFHFEDSAMVRLRYADGSVQDVTDDQLVEVVNHDYTTEWIEAKHAKGRVVITAKKATGFTFVPPESDEATNAYIIGLFIAEGSGSGAKDSRANISMTDYECIEYVKTYMKKVGVYTNGINAIENDNPKYKTMYRMRVSKHEDVYTATRHTAENKEIDSKLLENVDLYAPLLAGLWDGDGYLRAEESKNAAVYTTVSIKLAQQIYSMLARIGIRSAISEYKDSINVKQEHSINGRVINHNHPLIQVNVIGYEARKLAKIIEPYIISNRKKTAAKTIANNEVRYVPSQFSMAPSGYIFEELSNLHLGGGWFKDVTNGKKFRLALDKKDKIRYGKSEGRTINERPLDLNRAVVQGWLDKLKRIGSPLAERLEYLSGRFFIPVTQVEILPNSDSYDVEIAHERHAFVVEGKTYHNCMGVLHPHGDCLAGDTLILDIEGNEYTLAELAETGKSLKVSAVNKKGQIVTAVAHSFRIGQHATDIYHITMQNGHVVKATSNHPFLTDEGAWVKAEDLYAGTSIRSAFYHPDQHSSLELTMNEVVNIKIEKLASPVPMFDFTVDGHSNLFIAQKINSGYSMLVAHNSAIYDAMVRMAQPFSMRTVLVDGHGNFGGTPDDSAASSRYTEAKLSKEGVALIGEIKEESVDFVPNFDGSTTQPSVLPAGFPNLLINGTSGIAVGMATNMPPHNPTEAVEAVKHLILNPDAGLDELLTIVKGPDFPTGGVIVGYDQLKDAYTSGKGIIKIRARIEIEELKGGKHRLIAVEHPYQVGFEKIISSIKDEISKKRLQGISKVIDLSDRRLGNHLSIELKAGVNPKTAIAALYRYTPLEVSFGIQNLTLVDGQPKYVGLKELLTIFINHRRDVVTRRTQFRKDKKEARLHLVKGLVLVLADIDKAIHIIRNADDSEKAKTGLISHFKIDDIQGEYILSLQLRRLTKYDTLELNAEHDKLVKEIAELDKILGSQKVLDKLIIAELDDVLKIIGSERRSEVSLEAPVEYVDAGSGKVKATIEQAHLPEETVYMTHKGQLTTEPAGVIIDKVTFKGTFLGITKDGQAHRMRTGDQFPNLIAVAPDAPDGVIALGTKEGVVKLVAPNYPTRSDDFTIINLAPKDEVVGARWVKDVNTAELVFFSNDSSLLKFPASKVRPQGANAGGVAGINLVEGCQAIYFGVSTSNDTLITTFTGQTVKTTPLALYPPKGRGSKGVRSHKFLKGETELTHAVVGENIEAFMGVKKVKLPEPVDKRDGSGTKATLNALHSAINS